MEIKREARKVSAIFGSSALDVDFEQMVEEPTIRVPRLDDLCVKFFAENIDRYPALDHIKSEYVAAAVELIDTNKISYETASKHIKNEMFWKKIALARWPRLPNEIAEHGMSWRRLYAEIHIQEQFEKYYPSKCGTNLEVLEKEVGLVKPFIQTIRFRKLRAEIDLSKVLGDVQNLQTLDLTYGHRGVGMGYEKALFGIKPSEAMHLSRLIANSKALTRLILKENLLSDEAIQILCSGMSKNNTVTFLDLSHNKISDSGAVRLAKLLSRGSMLIDLNLSDNIIRKTGAEELAKALAENDILGTLSLRQNYITDDGGECVLKALCSNDTLTELDLGANKLGGKTGEALKEMLVRNKSVTSIDLSCNSVLPNKKVTKILDSLEVNKSITRLDLRKNVDDQKELAKVKKLLRTRQVKTKQDSRKKYQAGWDLLDDLIV
mmetsp:Transcript_7272/g.13587  ORF Transcript_7272/g.13587 Transcript_7272/m.13587 type:complete len:435 (+) Transcript_7272:62-1366(+)|eukprot:CAMPEP_0197530728 /NCGR_PEP_ID=MMETSP1318-20131121/32724_1 /TAXON_ID=552666 /ORGANISM="Partenskyella glossopodia, Strain RCC365" /LENGTH=434 /DNA_ID=CAMNT_0043086671 /DNA_START=39 /DNA_END=1343 /DNA_ORIENTATION=+